jgi:two-component system NtrC family sensor kinase
MRRSRALTEALEQQNATAELLRTRTRELADVQEQQTATAEILRVIASSPTDLQTVMEAVAENAARVCGATDSSIFRVDEGGLRLVTRHGGLPRLLRIGDAVPLTPDTVVGRAVAERRTLHVEDLHALPETGVPGDASAPKAEFALGVSDIPGHAALARRGATGAIVIRRAEVRPFTTRQIELLETFAHQAVIAIENVRLFNETKEALEQQTATADILRVIASSPTDLQPVFDAIAERAMNLCGASSGGVTRLDGELIHLAALANVSPEAAAAIRSMFPMPPSPRSAAARAILTGGLVHIPDVVEDSEYGIATQTQAAFRSVVSVPMLYKRRGVIGLAFAGPTAPSPPGVRSHAVARR